MQRADRASNPPADPKGARVLLLVTTRSYRAGAFLEAASTLGVAMVVGTERPQALGMLRPEGHLDLPFHDPEKAVDRIVAFARLTPLAAVIAADDDGAKLAALAREALELEGHASAAVRVALDKRLAREAFARAGLPTPWFRSVSLYADPEAEASSARYPCVLKPLASSASRGVIRADDPAAFVEAFRRIVRIVGGAAGAGADRALLVEGYIPGVEVALEGLIDHGRLVTLAVFDKPDPLEGPFFEETLYVTPSRHPAARLRAIEETVERAAAALGLAHGPVHAELRLGPEGVWPLEMAPRSIGGLCSRALRFEGDRSLETVLLAHALGRGEGTPRREAAASGVMMIPIPHGGILRGVRGLDEARRVPGVSEVRITVPPGDRLVPLPEGDRYLGFVFGRAASPGAVESALRESHRRLVFDIERSPSSETPRKEQA
jgi:biotin carboxylase